MDKIPRIWDTVLVSPPSLPLFIALAIMEQLRELLLPLDFNAFILLFSSMPVLDIEKCIREALKYLKDTPPSITTPHYSFDNLFTNSQNQQNATNNNNPNKNDSKPSSTSRWWEQPIPLDILKTELFARISVNDLMMLKSNALILDTRSEPEFEKLHFPDSFRVKDIQDTNFLKTHKTNPIPIIVIGDSNSSSQVQVYTFFSNSLCSLQTNSLGKCSLKSVC